MPDHRPRRFPRPPRCRRPLLLRPVPLRQTRAQRRDRIPWWARCLREPALSNGRFPRNKDKRYPDWCFDSRDRRNYR